MASASADLPDAGLFRGTALGQELAGQGIQALSAQWVEGLTDDPLLARVELEGSSGAALTFYRQTLPAPDAGALQFKRFKRFDFGDARLFDQMTSLDLGAEGGPALMVVLREDLPEDPAVRCLIVGRDLKVLYKESAVDSRPKGRALSMADRPVGFSWLSAASGRDGPALQVDQDSQWIPLEGPAGEVSVEIGRHRSWYGRKGGAFIQIAGTYADLLAPRKIEAPGHPRLVDGKPATYEHLQVGNRVELQVADPGPITALRIISGCPPKGGAAPSPATSGFRLTSGDRVFEVSPAGGTGPGLLGAGAFTAGVGWATQELVFFDPPLNTSRFTLEVTPADAGGGSVCVSEVTAHSGILR
jgi:hypothetical protein